MLVAVLMLFVVFSFTGVAVLNVSYLSSATSQETVNNIKLQYAMESSVNESLWRINTGTDSLVNNTVDGITTVWDASSNVLSVNVDMFEMESEILLDLSEDTHFDRSISAVEEIVDNGNTVNADEERQSRSFDFLPEVDLQYFLDNAVAIHNQSWHEWDTEDLTEEGIHVFTGSLITLRDIELDNSTLVFTGRHVFLRGENVIRAPLPVDSLDADPAIVFTNPRTNFYVSEGWNRWGHNESPGDHIEGAIYCAGNIYLRNGTLTGPIVGKMVSLDDQFNFLDTEYNTYYRWTKGFGHKHNYDWPKQIGRWKHSKWNRKHNA